MPFLKQTPDGCELSVRVQPGASRSGLAGLHGTELKVRIKAPPVEGKANDALLEFLAETLRVRRSACEIVRGDKSRSKVVLVRGTEEALARAILVAK
ncbi:MAG: YggU family protein [Verrucomicrobia bacterium]|nr:YggU family protein [Verrucomicrobiota bacterium]